MILKISLAIYVTIIPSSYINTTVIVELTDSKLIYEEPKPLQGTSNPDYPPSECSTCDVGEICTSSHISTATDPSRKGAPTPKPRLDASDGYATLPNNKPVIDKMYLSQSDVAEARF